MARQLQEFRRLGICPATGASMPLHRDFTNQEEIDAAYRTDHGIDLPVLTRRHAVVGARAREELPCRDDDSLRRSCLRLWERLFFGGPQPEPGGPSSAKSTRIEMSDLDVS